MAERGTAAVFGGLAKAFAKERALKMPSEMPSQDRADQSHSTDSHERTVLKADQARQGVTGHNVRYVLGFGLVGAILVVFLAGFLVKWFG